MYFFSFQSNADYNIFKIDFMISGMLFVKHILLTRFFILAEPHDVHSFQQLVVKFLVVLSGHRDIPVRQVFVILNILDQILLWKFNKLDNIIPQSN